MGWVGKYATEAEGKARREWIQRGCWWLPVRVFGGELGVELPQYQEEYQTLEDEEEIRRLIERERGLWQEIPKGSEEEFDLALVRSAGEPWHVAVVTRPGWFAQYKPETGVTHECYHERRWHHRILGFYRHESRLAPSRPSVA